ASRLPHSIHETFPVPDGHWRSKRFRVLELLLVLLMGIGLTHASWNHTGQANTDIQLIFHVSNEFVETFEAEISFSSWLDGCDERPECENRIIEQVFRSRVRIDEDSVVLFVQLVCIPEQVIQEFE